MLLDKIVLR